MGTTLKLLEMLGATTKVNGNVTVLTGAVNNHVAPYELVNTMRASIPALARWQLRFGAADVSCPAAVPWCPPGQPACPRPELMGAKTVNGKRVQSPRRRPPERCPHPDGHGFRDRYREPDDTPPWLTVAP